MPKCELVRKNNFKTKKFQNFQFAALAYFPIFVLAPILEQPHSQTFLHNKNFVIAAPFMTVTLKI